MMTLLMVNQIAWYSKHIKGMNGMWVFCTPEWNQLNSCRFPLYSKHIAKLLVSGPGRVWGKFGTQKSDGLLAHKRINFVSFSHIKLGVAARVEVFPV